jgi:(p)ppGpp synthase/HD superfamily hydrolase
VKNLPALKCPLPHPTIDETVELIKRLHKGQTDKAGQEYWRHPVAVMNRIPGATPHECHVALLHDVLEDNKATARDLLQMRYDFEIVWHVRSLTKPDGLDYLTWIGILCALGERAVLRVKRADIEHNLDENRLDMLPREVRHHLERKYWPALALIENRLDARGAEPCRETH